MKLSPREKDKMLISLAAIIARNRKDRGVKQAGFMVLYRTTMPSVLIETGFLTNPKEENFIGKDLGQNKMANAMFDAFVKYKNKIEGTDSDISETKGEPEKMDKETNTDSEITDDIDKLEKENSGLIFRVQKKQKSFLKSAEDEKDAF